MIMIGVAIIIVVPVFTILAIVAVTVEDGVIALVATRVAVLVSGNNTKRKAKIQIWMQNL